MAFDFDGIPEGRIGSRPVACFGKSQAQAVQGVRIAWPEPDDLAPLLDSLVLAACRDQTPGEVAVKPRITRLGGDCFAKFLDGVIQTAFVFPQGKPQVVVCLEAVFVVTKSQAILGHGLVGSAGGTYAVAQGVVRIQ